MTKINNNKIGYEKELDVLMLIFSSIQYSNNHTTGRKLRVYMNVQETNQMLISQIQNYSIQKLEYLELLQQQIM